MRWDYECQKYAYHCHGHKIFTISTLTTLLLLCCKRFQATGENHCFSHQKNLRLCSSLKPHSSTLSKQNRSFSDGERLRRNRQEMVGVGWEVVVLGGWVGAAPLAVCSTCRWCQNYNHLQWAEVGFYSVGQVVIYSRTCVLYIRGH